MLSTIITPSAARGIEHALTELIHLGENADRTVDRLVNDCIYLDTRVSCRQWYRDEQRWEAAELAADAQGDPDWTRGSWVDDFDPSPTAHLQGFGECAPESHANYEEPAGYYDVNDPCDCGCVTGPLGFYLLHESGSHPDCEGSYSCGAAYCDEPRCTTHSPRFADWR